MWESSVGVRYKHGLVFALILAGCGGKAVEGAGDDGDDSDSTSTTRTTSTSTSGGSTTGGASNFLTECLAFCELLECPAFDLDECRSGCRSADPACVADYRNAFACFERVFEPDQPCEDSLLEAALSCQSNFERVDACERGD